MTKAMKGAERYNLLLALVGFLLKNNEVTVDDLATRFKVTPKEIRSAVSTITVSGIGSYAPNELFDIDFDRFENESVVQLTFNPAIDDVPRLSVRQAAALSAGLSYLRLIPDFEQQAEIDQLLDLLARGSNASPAPVIAVKPGTIDAEAATVRAAIVGDVQMEFEYRTQSGEQSRRVVDPLVLESIDNVWYLRAYCHTRQDIRNFRLDRMRLSRALPEARSEAGKAAVLSDDIYTPKSSDHSVVVDLSPEAHHLIADFKPESEPMDLGDNIYRITIKVENLAILGKVIARCAGAAVVVSPPEARKAVSEYALRALGASVSSLEAKEE
ncbi:MAG: helix-turn-helix transcriptional regulator [Micrococcales bacterium]